MASLPRTPRGKATSINLPETSFLCALYREQNNSDQADKYRKSLPPGPMMVSSLVLFEFRQSTRLHIHLHQHDKSLGFPREQANAMLRDLQSDLNTGVLEVLTVDWPAVHIMAEILSAKHTESGGHRFAEILHVATALQWGAETFLTFDKTQRKLARAEGLNTLD